MAYIRGDIQEGTRFHLGLRIPLSSISKLNTAMTTSLTPTKDIFMVCCLDGGKLVWKSNPTDFMNQNTGGATFHYSSRNNNFKLRCLVGNVYTPIVKNEDDLYDYDTDSSIPTDISLTCTEAVRTSLLWGGIEYSISYGTSSSGTLGDDLFMTFRKLTTPIAQGNTNSNDSIHGVFYNTNGTEVVCNMTDLGVKVFAIPHIDHSHHVDGLAQYGTGYTSSLDFFQDYINNTLPNNFIPLVEGTIANEDTIVIFTKAQDQKMKYVYRYCTAQDVSKTANDGLGGACGICMGICPNDEVCSVHSGTGKSGQPILTCDHTPADSAENDIKNYYIYGIIVFVLIVMVIVFFTLRKNYNMK